MNCAYCGSEQHHSDDCPTNQTFDEDESGPIPNEDDECD